MVSYQPDLGRTHADVSKSEHSGPTHEQFIAETMKTRVSRMQLLAGMGAGLAAALLPGMVAADGNAPGTLSFPFFPPVKGRYATEEIRAILDVLVTACYLRATFVTSNIVGGRVVPIPNE